MTTTITKRFTISVAVSFEPESLASSDLHVSEFSPSIVLEKDTNVVTPTKRTEPVSSIHASPTKTITRVEGGCSLNCPQLRSNSDAHPSSSKMSSTLDRDTKRFKLQEGKSSIRSALVVGPRISGKSTLLKKIMPIAISSTTMPIQTCVDVMEFLDRRTNPNHCAYAEAEHLHPAWRSALFPNVDAVFVSAQWINAGTALSDCLGKDLAEIVTKAAARDPVPEDTVAYQFYVLWPAVRKAERVYY